MHEFHVLMIVEQRKYMNHDTQSEIKMWCDR